MKNLFFAFAAILFVSCSSDVDVLCPNEEKEVTFSLNGDFQVSTRASKVTDAEDIIIFDYVEGKYVQLVHQMKNDTNFGNPSLTLSYGTHNLYFIVSKGTDIELQGSYGIIGWRNMGDTFWATRQITVDNNTNALQSVVLDRVTTKLKVKSTDIIPNDRNYINVTSSKWSNYLNYITGKPSGIGMTSAKYTLTEYSSYVELTWYGFATNEEYVADVTIDYYSTSGLVKSSKKNNVPFKANRTTTLTGSVFEVHTSNDYNCSIYLNSDWETDFNMEW